MNVNTRIKNALAGLANGNIWPNTCPLSQEPNEWIVYYPLSETPVDHGDDTDTAWFHFMGIHWIKRGNVNYVNMRKELRNRLKAAGFTVTEILPSYDDAVDATHLIIYCNIIEEDFDGTY